MRLTLRTLLAYLDDTLPPAEAGELGRKLAGNPDAQTLVDRIRTVTRRRGIAAPTAAADRSPADPNAAAEYLSDVLPADETAAFETACLADDAYVAEVAACHQVLTLVLSEQVKVPPTARSRMYALVKGQEAVPGRRPKAGLSVATVRDSDSAADADADADAQLLLGLPAYAAGESGGRRAARLAAVAALLAGFGLCLWMAWPATDAPTTDRPAFVMTGPTTPAPTTPTAAANPTPPPPTVPVPAAPATTPEPDKPAQPVPPKADRLAIGQLEKPAGGATGLLLRRAAAGDTWERVGTDAGGVFATDRLVCLPGYKAALKLESGATVDLWGNLPELVPVPLLAAGVTPALPADGSHADLLVHAGRVYLGGRQPGGVKVRLRFAGQVWDVALPDDKAEVVFELVHLPTPGEQPTAPASTARLVTLNGPAVVTPDGEPPFKLEKSAGVVWTTAAGAKPQLLPPLSRADREPLARLSTIPPAAQPTLAALDELARRAADGGQVPALLDELVQVAPDSRAMVAGSRVGVYGLAALGRVDKLADLLASPTSPLARQMAAEALGPTLAADPSLSGPVRRVLVEQKRLSGAEADEVFRLLRGLSPADRADPATLDRLLADLASTALPLRELALGNLIGLTPPEERARVTAPPFVYDVAAPEEDREAGQKAWKQRAEQMKKKLAKG